MKKELLKKLGQAPLYMEIEEALRQGEGRISVSGLSPTDEVFFYLELQARLGRPLCVVKEEGEGESLALLLQEWIGEGAAFLPKRNLLPYRTMVRSHEDKYRRLDILSRLLRGEISILLMGEEAWLDRYGAPEVFRKKILELSEGMEVSRDELLSTFSSMGYQKEATLELQGQYAVRGDIVDIFPVAQENPLRLDFFGDTLERIKIFDLEEQRTLSELPGFTLAPAGEFLPEPGSLEKGAALLLDSLPEAGRESLLEEELVLLSQGIYGEESERFFPAFTEGIYGIRDYFQTPPALVLADYGDLRIRAGAYWQEMQEDYREGEAQGLIHPLQREAFHPPAYLEEGCGSPVFYTSEFQRFEEGPLALEYGRKAIPPFRNDLTAFLRESRRLLEEGVSLWLLGSTPEKAASLEKLARDMKLEGDLHILSATLEESFLLPEPGVALIGEKDIYGLAKKAPGVKKVRKLNPFIDIKPGDYVVHEEYGIALYKGMESKEILGQYRDYLNLEFAGTGRLFLPVENMDVVEKYIGGEGHRPKLSNLSNNEWRKTKERVRISVSEIAKDLLALYSQRKLATGHAYTPDGPDHQDFAARFPYVETEDQAKAIEDVRQDMEKAQPMDRVVIGDVGYGKTEVALRAAFKAVMDGKQVAVLSPTTVLSQQHYRTFAARFEGLPFRIGLLNRFVGRKEQQEVLQGLADGTIDILIGTHRILSKDIAFRDLGLLVIDEEQKFGVAHKEKIKNLKHSIDCLVLSATPIPRTLHMALAGVRDLSVIETAPKERHPVQTYVLEHEENIIRKAILKELKREGQVFYVYNRVETMEARYGQLTRLVPEARIAMAHGQMDEKTLEARMMAFLEGEVDLLLCTTIIENGLDIRNANTLIVEEADRLGLSQIYQLKGRVGRSSRLAYAYFLFHKARALTENARKRLKAIRELTELGSGFKIAMLDLEIRGAGNLLGREQHGHMLTVGFDLYCKILEDEVNRLAREGGEESQRRGVELDLDLPAYLPDTYVGDVETKTEIYKKLASLGSTEELLLLLEEVRDRFGKLPSEAENLFRLGEVRLLAQASHLEKVRREKNTYILTPRKGWYTLEDLQRIRLKFKGRVFFRDRDMVLLENQLYLLEFFLKELAAMKG